MRENFRKVAIKGMGVDNKIKVSLINQSENSILPTSRHDSDNIVPGTYQLTTSLKTQVPFVKVKPKEKGNSQRSVNHVVNNSGQ